MISIRSGFWRNLVTGGLITFIPLVIFISYSYSVYRVPMEYKITFPASITYKINWNDIYRLQFPAEITQDTLAWLDYVLGELHAAGTDKVCLIISSYGGYVDDTIAMYDVIMRYRRTGMTIYTYAEGYAMSGGTILLMAGEKRFMSPNAILLIHHPYCPSFIPFWDIGTRKQIRESLDVSDGKMRGIYLLTTQNLEFLNLYDTTSQIWLTPEQAMKYGLIDGVI